MFSKTCEYAIRELIFIAQKYCDDLGTTREVITRLMKNLVLENKIIQKNRVIQVLF